MKPQTLMKLLMLAVAVASCWMGPQQAVAQPQGANVRVLEHVSYGVEAPQAQMLNAYLVQRDTPTAAFIQIASGGWNSAPPQKANPRTVQTLSRRRHLGHRRRPSAHRQRHPLARPRQRHRPGDPVRAGHAGEWGIDPNRIAVKGRSSGGHLALMVGFGPDRANRTSADPVERQSSRPNCIVAGAAPTDLVAADERTPEGLGPPSALVDDDDSPGRRHTGRDLDETSCSRNSNPSRPSST